MNILFFIRSLEQGGAERQLLVTAQALAKDHKVTILTFYEKTDYDLEQFRSDGLEIVSLKKSGRWDMVVFVWRFLCFVNRLSPDIIYAFMSTACVISIFSKLLPSSPFIVWGVRSSNVNLSFYGRLNKLFRNLECCLSKCSNLIISNSYAGKKEAISDGFKENKFIVIPNGIDTNEFCKKLSARDEIRKELKADDDVHLIGLVARHDPMKGIDVFLKAASLYVKIYPKTCFVIIGSGVQGYTHELKEMAFELSVQDSVRWIAKTNRVFDYYSAMDVFTSASRFGEGFSNTIGEAMSAELPCVVTDVGDAALIVGEYGIVIPIESAEKLCEAWSELLGLSAKDRFTIGAQLRQKIVDNFSVDALVRETENALLSELSKKENGL